MRWDEATPTLDKWGEMRKYMTGEAAGVKDLFTAVAVVKPGEALHKAHRHAEEEFLVITEGSGVWSLDGKDIPLKKGDLLYVEPWVMHGFTNTGSTPLTFFVAKWNGKGVPVPPEPPTGR
jgi:mannose-6-phosphate isomerase-like protein (cupin superfamily)